MSETSRRVVTSPDQLRGLVGQELGVSPWLEITQHRVDAFADVTGDRQYIHVDPERAARTPLGGTVAHGFLTLSLLPSLGDARNGVVFELHPKMRINYGLNRVRFPAPVRVGKRIRLRTTLQSVEPVGPDVYQLVYLQTMEIEGETKPALVAETISRLYL
jgi:acyl dehydratase